MTDRVQDLLSFIDRSPTPYHAVSESASRLEAVGFARLEEGDPWSLSAGDRCYVVRAGGSIAAFEVGQVPGGAVVGAHTDSPNLRIKPEADVAAHGYRQLAVEPYGSVLLHTWLDRISPRGSRHASQRVGDRDAAVDFARPLCASRTWRSISIARSIPQPQAERPAPPRTPRPRRRGRFRRAALRGARAGRRDGRAAGRVRLGPDGLLQPSTISGADGEFIRAPRLDNLASSHAGLCALTTAAEAGPRT